MINNEERIAIINKHLENGVEIPCSDGVIIEDTVKLEQGVVIMPNTILLGNTEIKSTFISVCYLLFQTYL